MKVNDDRPHIKELTQVQPPHSGRSAVNAAEPFSRVLQTSNASADAKILRDLLDRINEQGERLAARSDVAELKKYRQMVTDFLSVAQRGTYEPDRESLFDPKGRFKEYSVVKKVNVELETLTQQVLSEQKDNLAVLEQLGIIRGMLVDLLI